MREPIIRRNQKAKNGWDNGDLDVAFQLFSCGLVSDGYLASKCSRDHLVDNGYAIRGNGIQAMTGRGVAAFLLNRHTWASAWRRWRLAKRNPFVASAETIATVSRG